MNVGLMYSTDSNIFNSQKVDKFLLQMSKYLDARDLSGHVERISTNNCGDLFLMIAYPPSTYHDFYAKSLGRRVIEAGASPLCRYSIADGCSKLTKSILDSFDITATRKGRSVMFTVDDSFIGHMEEIKLALQLYK